MAEIKIPKKVLDDKSYSKKPLGTVHTPGPTARASVKHQLTCRLNKSLLFKEVGQPWYKVGSGRRPVSRPNPHQLKPKGTTSITCHTGRYMILNYHVTSVPPVSLLSFLGPSASYTIELIGRKLSWWVTMAFHENSCCCNYPIKVLSPI